MKRIKPFLTLCETGKNIAVGITSRFRAEFDLPDGTDCRSMNELALIMLDHPEIERRLDELMLLDDNEKFDDADSRTLSFLSLHTNKPAAALQKIRNTRVLVAGAGGLGSRLILELSALGVSNITVTDPDVLSESNLPRMFYFQHADVGKKKVDAIREKVKNIHPNTRIQTIDSCSEEYVSQLVKDQYDFVFLTADGDDAAASPRIGLSVSKSQIAHMVMGYWESLALVGPLITAQSPHDLAEIYHKHSEPKRSHKVRDFIPPSVGFVNALIIGVGLNEFVKYIVTGKSEIQNRQWKYDLLHMNTSINPINM